MTWRYEIFFFELVTSLRFYYMLS